MKTERISLGFVSDAIPKRRKWSHKGEGGRVLVIGGNEMYTGAPLFVGMGAYRSGCDLVFVAAPKRAADSIAFMCPDIITEPLKGKCLDKKHLKRILEMSKRVDSVVIGNGIGKLKKSISVMRRFLERCDVPCVVDADGIYAIAEGNMKRNFIITPHLHEFFVLSGKNPGEKVNDRIKAAREYARKSGHVVLLKGAVDVISDGNRTAINTKGNVYMTKGGTGDILAGICGGLISRGVKEFEAACAAAWINGYAGERAFKKYGPSLTASDVLGCVPDVMKRV